MVTRRRSILRKYFFQCLWGCTGASASKQKYALEQYEGNETEQEFLDFDELKAYVDLPYLSRCSA